MPANLGDGLGNYTTLPNLKLFMNIDPSNTAYDNMLTNLIRITSRLVDDYTNNQFYQTTETRIYDWQHSRIIWLDKKLNSLTSITNGDGTVVANSNFILYPLNSVCKRKIEVNFSSGQLFNWTGTKQAALQVGGTWGEVDQFGNTPDTVAGATNIWIDYMVTEAKNAGIILTRAENFEIDYDDKFMAQMSSPPGSVALILDRHKQRDYSIVNSNQLSMGIYG